MIRFRSVGFAVVGLGVWLGFGREAVAQTSTYYLTDPGNSLIYGIRGGQLVMSAPFAYAPNPGLDPSHPGAESHYESDIAVYGDVRTLTYVPGGSGGQYSLDLTPTGTTYSFPGLGGGLEDGTSDGTHNYSIASQAGEIDSFVVQYDRNWANPVRLFGGLNSYDSGITYDTVNHSLWEQNYESGVITDYSMDGTVLSRFSTNSGSDLGLGYDPVDGTLWFTRSPGYLELEQYSTSGVLLQDIAISGIPSDPLIYGGEFDESLGANAVPEPSTLVSALIGIGIVAGCAVIRRENRLSVP